MFVFAADDVSKKDLKKISKKIERQLAKWEENDQEKTEKRKRNDDGIGVKDDGADEEISSRKKKKIKTEEKTDNKEDPVPECSCSVSFVDQNSETDEEEHNGCESIESEESKQNQESNGDELIDWEIIIDVNEKGHCSFTTVNDLENHQEALHNDVEVHVQTDISRTNDLHDVNNLKEYDLIIDVNEDGKCKFKVVQERKHPSSVIDIKESLATRCSNDETSNLCQHVCETESDTSSLSCSNTGFKLKCEAEELETKDKKLLNRTKNKFVSSTCAIIHSTKHSDNDHDVDIDNEKAKRITDEIQSVYTCDSETNLNCNQGEQQSEVSCDKNDKHEIVEEGTASKDQSDLDNTGLSYDDGKAKSIPEECDIVALDCEFVGVGPHDQSALGRCSIVDFHGNIVCDIYARPEERITNYRTRWSGITKQHMKRAIPVESALSQIANIIQNKVVVGHALKNDFSVLDIPHPLSLIRDTAFYRPLRQKANPNGNSNSIALRTLTQHLLDRVIQKGKHCSVEDARAAMDLYKLVRDEWEDSIIQGNPIQDEIIVSENTVKNRNKREKKKQKRELKRQKSAASLKKFDHNAQTNNFHRSKSDSNLLPRQQNHSYNGNMNYGNSFQNGNQGYRYWAGNQQLLQDEYWQDDAWNDESWNSFSSSNNYE